MIRWSTPGTLALMLLFAAAGGCWPIGAVIYKAVGPMPVDAEFVPDPTQRMLVLVERYADGGSSGSIEATQDSESLARAIQSYLAAKQVAPLVDSMSVSALRTADPMKFRSMTVSQIGAAVGAQQVLYVNVLSSSLYMAQGSGLLAGQMAARAKLIDVATGQILWPPNATDGKPVAVQMPTASMSEDRSPQAARMHLIRLMGEAIARNFYKWQPEYNPTPE